MPACRQGLSTARMIGDLGGRQLARSCREIAALAAAARAVRHRVPAVGMYHISALMSYANAGPKPPADSERHIAYNSPKPRRWDCRGFVFTGGLHDRPEPTNRSAIPWPNAVYTAP